MKKFDLNRLVRPNIQNLQPYRCARDDYDSGILLDANENSFGSLIPSDLELHRYPDPYQNKLRKAVAEFRNVRHEQVFMGSGSDEAIDLIMRAFCEPGKDSILITPPTYGMYKVSAGINGNAVIEVPLSKEFQLRTNAIRNHITASTKIIFLCSPNNPTANLLNRDDLFELLESFSGLVVVDEAYIDFSEQPSLVSKLNRYPNLIVLQTFSKAFGLAGVRLGVAIASGEIIRVILKIKAPYNINKLTARMGLQAFDRLGEMKSTVQNILKEKDRLIGEFDTLKGIVKVFPTDANFILIRVKNAKEVYRKLAANGVIVRFRGDQVHCEDTLRITVGTPEQNNELLRNLRELLS